MHCIISLSGKNIFIRHDIELKSLSERFHSTIIPKTIEMRNSTLYLLALFTPLGLHAAPITFPASTITANSPAPTQVGVSVAGLATVAIDSVNSGTASGGSWQAEATGGVNVALLPVFPLPSLGAIALTTRTQVTNSQLNFNTHTEVTGVVGSILGSAPILTNIVGAGFTPQWEATVNLNDLGLNLTPSTQYALTFDVSQSNSLLGNLSPSILNRITASVGDSTSVFPAQVLGLTDLVGSTGKLTLNFTTDPTIDGPITATFGGSALLNTTLLGSILGSADTNLYSLSTINVVPIPEPATWVFSAIFAGSAVLRRRR